MYIPHIKQNNSTLYIVQKKINLKKVISTEVAGSHKTKMFTLADIPHIILDYLQLILSQTLIFAQVCAAAAAAIILLMKTVAQ